MMSIDKDYGFTKRYRRKFLLRPRKFDGVTIWLEFVWIREEFMQHLTAEPEGGMCSYHAWTETGFASEAEAAEFKIQQDAAATLRAIKANAMLNDRGTPPS